MDTLSEIYLNYNEAIGQAQQLDDIAMRLTNAANVTMEDILGDIYHAWNSDSTPAYLKKGEKVEQDLCATAKDIQNIAQTVRTIALRIRNAELEAWRIANERA